MRARCSIAFCSVAAWALLGSAPMLVHAQTIQERLESVGQSAELQAPQGTSQVSFYVGRIIQGALALIGAIFVAQMVYAGYLWMTARGESDQVDKAKDTIQRSVIGLVIVLAAFTVTQFVLDRLITRA